MTNFSARFDQASKALAEEVERGGLPGGVLAAWSVGGSADHGLRVATTGVLDETGPDQKPVQADTWYDIASLTKVVLTTTVIMRFVQEGVLNLTDPLGRILPDMMQVYAAAGGGETDHPLRRLTLSSLLSHQSGLPAWFPLYTYGDDPARLRAFLLQRDWPLGAKVYSDLNFMFLGIIIERLRGCFLAQDSTLLQDLPEGIAHAPPVDDNVAPTERCAWRDRVMTGEVHDENAHALGGLAGHAGLFARAAGLVSFARALLADDRPRFLSAETRQLMTTRQSDTYALGWQVPHLNWSGGDLCSPATIGHTGFTGTSLHIDQDHGLAWCLLTNRVYPSRHGGRCGANPLPALRRAVAARLYGGEA